MSELYQHWHFHMLRRVDDDQGTHDDVRMTSAAKNYIPRMSKIIGQILPIGCWEHLDSIMFKDRLAELRGADAREFLRLTRIMQTGGEDLTDIPPETDGDRDDETIQERMARLSVSRSTEYRRRLAAKKAA